MSKKGLMYCTSTVPLINIIQQSIGSTEQCRVNYTDHNLLACSILSWLHDESSSRVFLAGFSISIIPFRVCPQNTEFEASASGVTEGNLMPSHAMH